MAFGHQRSESVRLVLREIAQAGLIPRIDLAERTGMSRATITKITSDLLRGGLIEEVHRNTVAETQRGRPRIDLKLANAQPFSAGVKIAGASISYVLVDFEGKEVAAVETDLPAGRYSVEFLTQQIVAGIEKLTQAAACDPTHVKGVGVGLAGLVQAETGLVYWSPSLQARNVNMADHLSDALQRPVYVDNDANLVAEAERLYGLGKNHSDFIVVALENGIGMGIVLGGELYRGTRGSGGEFGHTKVQLEGALCRCEQRGCLEAYISDYALHREALAIGLVAPNLKTEDAFSEILRAAATGSPAAGRIVDRARRMFALGLANLVNIFDPELIILAGAQTQFEHLYADTVAEEMVKSIVDIDRPAPKVVVHVWGNRIWALGPAAYALEFVRDAAVLELIEDDQTARAEADQGSFGQNRST